MHYLCGATTWWFSRRTGVDARATARPGRTPRKRRIPVVRENPCPAPRRIHGSSETTGPLRYGSKTSLKAFSRTTGRCVVARSSCSVAPDVSPVQRRARSPAAGVPAASRDKSLLLAM
jgi:hypothetical protein